MKILTSWNGLTIKDMAVAGRRLGRDDVVQARFSGNDSGFLFCYKRP
ncbi:MAG: hypothetical protein GXP17_00155 [Gammaproteobacteria bacterium]|nr:hypothetical protein [Gammaproteobacteria bacterium]